MVLATLTNSIIDDFGEQVLVMRDDLPQSVVNGVIVPASNLREFSVIASVQPLRGQELLMFPETDRIRQSVRLYSYSELKIIDEALKTKADYVQWRNILFEIVSVETWVDGDFVYFKSIGRRKDRA